MRAACGLLLLSFTLACDSTATGGPGPDMAVPADASAIMSDMTAVDASAGAPDLLRDLAPLPDWTTLPDQTPLADLLPARDQITYQYYWEFGPNHTCPSSPSTPGTVAAGGQCQGATDCIGYCCNCSGSGAFWGNACIGGRCADQPSTCGVILLYTTGSAPDAGACN